LRWLSVLGSLSLAATSQAAVNPRPTAAAITHWKKTVLKPANLRAWWDGYLGGPTHLTGCKYISSKGVTFYDCEISNLRRTRSESRSNRLQ
jgi:hypothetical protein